MSSAIDISSTQPPRISSDQPQFASLAAVTRQRLEQFRARQSAQSAIRGLGWMMVAVVMLLLVGIAIDALVHHTAIRWWLFGCLLGTTIPGLLVCCLWPLLAQPQWTSIATSMERLDPRLRNQLLSAVELAMQPVVSDSLAFRHQVQRGTATLVGPVDVAVLLPGSRVCLPALLGIAAISLLVLLCFAPGMDMQQRLSRILMPWANIGRISSVSIAIEIPDVSFPTSAIIIPRGEMLGIVARVDGPRPADVLLQTRTPEQISEPQLILMTLQNSTQADNTDGAQPTESLQVTSRRAVTSRFETILPIEAESLEFRVVASGAETPWYRLTTIPRPQIEKFKILAHPPAYSKLPDLQYSAKSANLTLLEGSKVRLTLTTEPSAPQLSGHLLWVSQSQRGSPARSDRDLDSAKSSHQPLRIDKAGQLFTEFSADTNREFKFELQHHESGIKNDFSPTFQLRIIEDLAPQVTWISPKAPSLIAGTHELLDLKLIVRDQLPIDSAIGRYRINSQDWQQVELQPEAMQLPQDTQSANDGVQGDNWTLTNLPWMFDLSKVGLDDADFLDIEVLATDRKQQQGSSSILRVMLSSHNSDLEPSLVEQSRQQIKQELAELARQLKPLAEEASQLGSKNERPPAEALNRLSELDHQLHQEATPKLTELRQKIEQLLDLPQDRVSQQELRGVGQLFEKWQNQALPTLQRLGDNLKAKSETTELAQVGPDKVRQQLVHPLADATRQIVDEITQTAENFQTVADNDVARRISAQSLHLSAVAKQLQQDGNEAGYKTEVLERRREILAQQVKELGKAIEQSQGSAGNQLTNQLQPVRQQLDQTQAILERPAAEFARQAASIPQALAQVRSQLASSLQQMANQGRRRTTQQAGTSGERMAEAIQQWDSSSTQAVTKTEIAADRLQDLRSLLTSGDTADRQFAADLGYAQRAMQQTIQSAESTPQQAKQVREIADSVRKLEAAHALEQATNTLSQLLLREGQSQYLQEMWVEHPRLWDAFAEQLERTVRLMRDAQIPNEIVGQTEQLQWNRAAGQAAEKIGERIWSNEPPITAKPQLLELNGSLQSLRQQLSAIADKARQSLQQQAPSLGQLAQQAANSSAELMDETQQLAENLIENKVPDPTARLSGLKQQVNPAAKPLQTLREALVDLAGSQNLLDEQQLEQARKADAALDVVAQAQRQLQDSLNSVQPATTSDEPAAKQMVGDLQQAASRQSDVANAMRNLAEFFEKSQTDSSTESVNSNNAENDLQRLDQIAKSLDTDRTNGDSTDAENIDKSQADKAYQQAQRLAQIAGLSPEQMLKSLERQLQGNSAMQAEMSEIAKDAAEQALRQLDRAHKRQSAVTPALEQSDPRIKMQKELMAHDLSLAKNEAAEMLQRLLHEADSAAQAGQVLEPARRLQEEIRQLQQSLATLPQINSTRPIEDLQASAKQIGSALDRLGRETANIEQALDKAAQTEMENQNDQQKKQLLRDAQSRRDRAKNQSQQQAERIKQSQQQVFNNTKNQLRQAAQELKQHQDQLSRTEKELQKQPNQQWLKDAVERQRRDVALSETKLESVRQFQEALEQRQQAADEFSKQVKQAAATELSQPNPYAQLAQSLSQQASQSAQQFAQQIDQWEQQLGIATEALGQEIASQANQEALVQNQVQSAAEDLARASRHESRLTHGENSQQLAELSTNTARVAEQPLQQSRDQLAQAQQSASGQDRPTGQASPEATSASIAAAQQANQAIQQAAQSLRETLNNEQSLETTQTSQSSNNSASNAKPQSASQSTASPSATAFSPEQMAQMLDELDRQLNSANPQSSATASQASSSQPSASQSSLPQMPATLAQAAQQLAEQMSRQRQATESASKASESASTSPATNSRGLSMARASAQPQPADAVRVLDVTRINDQWGELRLQEATQTVETQRDKSAGRYRRAIDAYFKALAESSSSGNRAKDSGAEDGTTK